MLRPRITGLAQIQVLARAGIDLSDLVPTGPWPVLVSASTDPHQHLTTWHADHKCPRIPVTGTARLGVVTLQEVTDAIVPGLTQPPREARVGLCGKCESGLDHRTASLSGLASLTQHTWVLWLLGELLAVSGADAGDEASAAARLDADSGEGDLTVARLLLADLVDQPLPAGPDQVRLDEHLHPAQDDQAAQRIVDQVMAAVTDRADRLTARLPGWAEDLTARDIAEVTEDAQYAGILDAVTPEQIRQVATEVQELRDTAAAIGTLIAFSTGNGTQRPAWITDALADHASHPLVRKAVGQPGKLPAALASPLTRLRIRAGLTAGGPYEPQVYQDTVTVYEHLRQAAAALGGPRLVEAGRIDQTYVGEPGNPVTDRLGIARLAQYRIVYLGAAPAGPARQMMLAVAPASAVAELMTYGGEQANLDLGPVEPGDNDETCTLASALWWSEQSPGASRWSEVGGSPAMTRLARLTLAGQPA